MAVGGGSQVVFTRLHQILLSFTHDSNKFLTYPRWEKAFQVLPFLRIHWNGMGSERCEKWSEGAFLLHAPHSKGKSASTLLKGRKRAFSSKKKISHFICVRPEWESGWSENEEICFLTSKHTPEHRRVCRRNWLDHGWPVLNGEEKSKDGNWEINRRKFILDSRLSFHCKKPFETIQKRLTTRIRFYGIEFARHKEKFISS